MKKNICFITSHYGVTKNGPGTFADNFIRHMVDDERFNLYVISSDTPTPKYGENLYHIKQSSSFGSTFATAFKIRKMIKKLDREFSLDCIYFNTFRLGLFSLDFKIPIYNNLNDYYFCVKHKNQSLKRMVYNNFWGSVYNRILNSAQKNFVNSEFTLNKILENRDFPKEKFIVTYKGIDTNKFNYKYNLIENKINFIFVGSDFDRKGLDLVIKALHNIKDKNLLNKLYVIGEDKVKEDKYFSLVKELTLENEVEFLGKLSNDEISKYHDMAHIMVLPSKREALGVSVIESAAAGTTVIASACGGIPEIISSGKEGILLPEPTPENISESIIELHEKPELREKMTKSAKKKISMFSFENIYKKIAKELNE